MVFQLFISILASVLNDYDYEEQGIEFPICGLVDDIDYLDCEMANNWNTGNTLSEDNIDLDLDITHIEN